MRIHEQNNVPTNAHSASQSQTQLDIGNLEWIQQQTLTPSLLRARHFHPYRFTRSRARDVHPKDSKYTMRISPFRYLFHQYQRDLFGLKNQHQQ